MTKPLGTTGVLALVLVAAGCNRASGRDSGALSGPRPESRPPATHTVDNTGYIDNGGRSSSERGRSEMSGMRATEAGGDRPTGTPGSGFPIPIEPSTKRSESSEAPPPRRDGRTTGAPGSAVVGRLAQAMCDQAQTCGRVGPKKMYVSAGACLEGVRPDALGTVDRAGCTNDFDPDAVSRCLGAIRKAACTTTKISAYPECVNLCVPR